MKNKRKEKEFVMNYKNYDLWTKEKLWKLRKEICIGSLFYNDYKNSFGIPEKDCCSFFDSFIEDCWMIEDEKENEADKITKLEDLYAKYDNPDALWDYFYSMEYPFG